MDLFHRKNLTAIRNHQTVVWTYTDADLGESVAEIFIRSPDGLYYVTERFTATMPELSLLYLKAYQYGVQSPRPFHLSGRLDNSVFYCAMALAISCCQAWNLDPATLLGEADSATHVTAYNLLEIKQHARWERAVFPGTWDAAAIRSLCEALASVQCARFARLILERTARTHGH